ncbi:unknown protein [Waddlia chondrophila 2032/99]|uniref:Uncharacterized protein n=1 Tax=Waddlia chondrophila 2032/99 TaxID=765953 RepID=F8LC01_9BACT|nr:unknown protein [Waddlia chondrophila 2032/99]
MPHLFCLVYLFSPPYLFSEGAGSLSYVQRFDDALDHFACRFFISLDCKV